MSDNDLVRLSLDVQSLMPDARIALRTEMERRQFPVKSIDWASQPQPLQYGQNVRGWLLFYCVCSVIFLPIYMLVNLTRGPVWVSLVLFPSSFLQAGSGHLLWRRDPNGLRWVRWGLLYLFALTLLILLLSLWSRNPEVIGGALGGSIVASIPSVGWWLYFRKSKRVCAVFGRNTEGFPWPRLHKKQVPRTTQPTRITIESETQEVRTEEQGILATNDHSSTILEKIREGFSGDHSFSDGEAPMYFNEGMRRLAIFVGVLGAVAGGFYAHKDLRNVPSERYQHRAFEKLAASDIVKRERALLLSKSANGETFERPLTTHLNDPWMVVSEEPLPTNPEPEVRPPRGLTLIPKIKGVPLVQFPSR